MKSQPVTEFDPEQFAKLCKALSHPARIMIVQHLKRLDQCLCGDIVEILPLAQSTVSQHLKCLKEVSLIQGTIKGPRTCYCLNREVYNQFSDMAGRL